MKKKVVALFILAAMVLAFAGCSNTKNVPVNNAEDASSALSDRADELAGPVIENLNGKVLVDSKDIKITAHEITFGEDTSANVYLKISNGTDKDLYFQTRNESVNDCVVNGILSEIVEAGSEKDIPLWFTDRDLAMYGIVGIRKIEFNFYIFTTDTFEEYMTSERVLLELEPKGNAMQSDRAENVLYEGDGIRVVELTDEALTRDAFEYTSVVLIENNTANELYVMSEPTEQEFIELFAEVPAGKTTAVNATLREMFGPDEMPVGDESPFETEHDPEMDAKEVTVSLTIQGAADPIHITDAHLVLRRGRI